MPPAYVKPYVRRQKNDAADAAAICEAVTRPSVRFIGTIPSSTFSATPPACLHVPEVGRAQ